MPRGVSRLLAGAPYEFCAAGPYLRASRLFQASRFRDHGYRDFGTRHRRHDGHCQRRQRRARAAPAVSGPGVAGPHRGGHAHPQRRRLPARAPRLRRHPRPGDDVRGGGGPGDGAERVRQRERRCRVGAQRRRDTEPVPRAGHAHRRRPRLHGGGGYAGGAARAGARRPAGRASAAPASAAGDHQLRVLAAPLRRGPRRAEHGRAVRPGPRPAFPGSSA